MSHEIRKFPLHVIQGFYPRGHGEILSSIFFFFLKKKTAGGQQAHLRMIEFLHQNTLMEIVDEVL